MFTSDSISNMYANVCVCYTEDEVMTLLHLSLTFFVRWTFFADRMRYFSLLLRFIFSIVFRAHFNGSKFLPLVMASRAAEHVEFKLSNDNSNTDIKRKHKKLLRKHVSDGNNCRKAQKNPSTINMSKWEFKNIRSSSLLLSMWEFSGWNKFAFGSPLRFRALFKISKSFYINLLK